MLYIKLETKSSKLSINKKFYNKKRFRNNSYYGLNFIASHNIPILILRRLKKKEKKEKQTNSSVDIESSESIRFEYNTCFRAVHQSGDKEGVYVYSRIREARTER